jgi:hypothetical protein
MLPTTALDGSDESSLNDSDANSDNYVLARARMSTPKKEQMDTFRNADEFHLFGTSTVIERIWC